MKRLIIEINYEDKKGLDYALNTIKERILKPGEFRSVREGYSVTGYLYVDEPAPTLINGELCTLIRSRMDDTNVK